MRSGFVVVMCIALAACQASNIGAREKGTLGGAAVGAGLGAIVGNQVGNTGAGVAIGSAFGALSGALIGNEIDNQDMAAAEQERRLSEQDAVLAENRRLIQELRSKGVDAGESSRGVVVNLPDVLFDFDRSTLTSSARGTVRDIADTLQGTGSRHISIEGHTDSVGTISYNQRLSEDRALAVSDSLIEHGVPRRRVSTRGYGETAPAASNNTDSGRQRNRRVEVIIENR